MTSALLGKAPDGATAAAGIPFLSRKSASARSEVAEDVHYALAREEVLRLAQRKVRKQLHFRLRGRARRRTSDQPEALILTRIGNSNLHRRLHSVRG